MDVKKLVPLDGWVTLSGVAALAVYVFGTLLTWWEQNSSIEKVLFGWIAVGIARKGDKSKKEAEVVKKEVEDLRKKVESNESFEDRVRRNQR